MKVNYFYVLRNKKNLTQVEMAKKLGITQSAYCKYEIGMSNPNYNTMKALRKEFKININKLFDSGEL